MRTPAPEQIGSLVAAEIRAEMARQGITKTMLAATTDIPAYTLTRRLSGATDLTIVELHAIATALGVSVCDLVTRAEQVAA